MWARSATTIDKGCSNMYPFTHARMQDTHIHMHTKFAEVYIKAGAVGFYISPVNSCTNRPITFLGDDLHAAITTAWNSPQTWLTRVESIRSRVKSTEHAAALYIPQAQPNAEISHFEIRKCRIAYPQLCNYEGLAKITHTHHDGC